MPDMAPLPTRSDSALLCEPSGNDVPDLTASDWVDADLAVVTADPTFAVIGLRLPFGRARVVWLGDAQARDALAELSTGGGYDVVVLDAESIGRDLRGEAIRCAAESLRTGGRVVVAISTTQSASTTWSAARAAVTPTEPSEMTPWESTPAGLTWWGVGRLEDRPCAVLVREESADPSAAAPAATAPDVRLATMEQAVHAVGRLVAEQRCAERHADLRERYDSEAALLSHLRTLADALEAEKQRRNTAEQRYETFMKRYKTLESRHNRLLGSKLGTLARHYWQLRKKLRRLAGPGATA